MRQDLQDKLDRMENLAEELGIEYQWRRKPHWLAKKLPKAQVQPYLSETRVECLVLSQELCKAGVR